MSNPWITIASRREDSEGFAKDLLHVYRAVRFGETLSEDVFSRLLSGRSWKEETVEQLLADSVAIREQIADELRRQAQQLAQQRSGDGTNPNPAN